MNRGQRASVDQELITDATAVYPPRRVHPTGSDKKLIRLGIPALATLLVLFAATPSEAGVITHTDLLTFETTRGMFLSPASAEQFEGLAWGAPLLCDPTCSFKGTPETFNYGGFTGGVTSLGFLGSIDTTTGAQVKFETSGKVGVNVGAKLSDGSVKITVPLDATLTVPDKITAGEKFTVSTTKFLGLHDLANPLVLHLPQFETTAPITQMYVNGVFDTKNSFYGKACAVGYGCAGSLVTAAATANFTPGPFPIIGYKNAYEPLSIFGYTIPFLPFGAFNSYSIYDPVSINPVAEDLPPFLNPSCVAETAIANFLCFPKPVQIGSIQATAPKSNSGGGVTGDQLAFLTRQHLLDLNVSLTGFVEAGFNDSGVGVLKNSVSLAKIGPANASVGYTIIDVTIGPHLGLQQDLDVNIDPAVRLEFDRPVTQMEMVQIGTQTVCIFSLFGQCLLTRDDPIFGIGPVTHPDGTVVIALGSSADLRFDSGVGQLLDYQYFLQDPMLSNKTSLTFGWDTEFRLGCLSFPLTDPFCAIDKRQDLSDKPVATLFDGSSPITGFQPVKYNDTQWFNALDQTQGPGTPGPTSPVPEPGTLGLILFGLLGITLFPRKKLSGLLPIWRAPC